MNAIDTAGLAYLLMASTGHDLSRYANDVSVEHLRDLGLIDAACKLTDAGREETRLVKDFVSHVRAARKA